MPEQQLTITELSEQLDIDVSTLRRYRKKGMPVATKKGKAHYFLESAVAIWMRDNNLTGNIGRKPSEGSEEYHQQRTRKIKAQADLAELQVKKENGLLVSKSEVEQGRLLRIQFVKGGLLGLPASLAPQLQGLTAQEIQTKLDSEVHRLLETFSKE